ncbi:UrcA family protein [Altererythrobacter sp. MF3-039]|uniref:UrcA family protein n=1 Tax=Altererythrobacter sp. MF3-039 TaxID=3252901 RepID=UPI00390CC556
MTNTITTKFASAVIALVLSTVSMAEVTSAQTVDPVSAQSETVEFSYTAQELATAEGAEALEERIDIFSRRVCHNSNALFPIEQRRDCRKNVADQLREQIFFGG